MSCLQGGYCIPAGIRFCCAVSPASQCSLSIRLLRYGETNAKSALSVDVYAFDPSGSCGSGQAKPVIYPIAKARGLTLHRDVLGSAKGYPFTEASLTFSPRPFTVDATAKFRMFTAAFASLSCCFPHSGHVHERTESGMPV